MCLFVDIKLWRWRECAETSKSTFSAFLLFKIENGFLSFVYCVAGFWNPATLIPAHNRDWLFVENVAAAVFFIFENNILIAMKLICCNILYCREAGSYLLVANRLFNTVLYCLYWSLGHRHSEGIFSMKPSLTWTSSSWLISWSHGGNSRLNFILFLVEKVGEGQPLHWFFKILSTIFEKNLYIIGMFQVFN